MTSQGVLYFPFDSAYKWIGIRDINRQILEAAASAHTIALASVISQQTLGCLSTDAYAGICLMICPTGSNVLFLIVIFSS
jgi:hypothetical protein